MKYLIGSKKEFNEFMNSISKKDKIGVVTHIDLDGIASAVLLEEILKQKGLKSNFIEFLYYTAESLTRIYEEKQYNKLFFCDWSADSFISELDKLRQKGDVLVFDHHPINEALEDKRGVIKTEFAYCSSHALFDLIKKDSVREKWGWLISSTIIGDYLWDKSDEAFNIIKHFYPSVEKDSGIWDSEPGKNAKIIAGALNYNAPNFKRVYDFILKKDLNSLKKESEMVDRETQKWINKFMKEHEIYPEKNLSFFYGNPKYDLTSIIASIISYTRLRSDTVIFVSDFGEDYVKASARNQTGKVNLGEFLRKCTLGFENSSAGGHIRAASSIFLKKDLDKFKENILR